ncbi:NAD dependent epimerase/dehydratase family protein [Biscogniauxia sp. FL1348]|nr:NAD dependent epimerase/dehydratase family protein [Biscogniauxia sp. FL1348]
MYTALVTGATGITGSAIVDALVNSPCYSEIYTLSRSQPCDPHPKVKHATLDLRASSNDMAKSLTHIPPPTHIYFCAYLESPDEAEASRINGAMLSNFLSALIKTGQIVELQHFVLTCGLKQYGVHLGQPKNPIFEDDDASLVWLEQDDRPPNFYYTQQRILEKAAEDAGNKWSWSATYPSDVIGFARANFMNLSTGIGLYAAVSKELAGSQLTSSRLHADFCLWAGQAPNVRNQRFNVVNGDTQSWQDLWPRLAARFGCAVPENMFQPGARDPYPGHESVCLKLHARPPAAEVEARIGLKGAFTQGELFCQIDLAKWAKRPEVTRAWEALRDRYGLEQESWDKATWGFLTFALGREYDMVASMSKARRMGWTGYADTWDAFQHTFRQLEQAKMLPPVADLKGIRPR